MSTPVTQVASPSHAGSGSASTSAIVIDDNDDGQNHNIQLNNASTTPSHPSPSTNIAASLPPILQQLRALIDTLPLDVPEGTDPSEPLAVFAIHPRLYIPDDAELPIPEGEEAWIYLDPVLNNVLGYEKKAADIASLICRGTLGIEGLFAFLLACVEEIGIGTVLLEGKVERLCDALELRCVT